MIKLYPLKPCYYTAEGTVLALIGGYFARTSLGGYLAIIIAAALIFLMFAAILPTLTIDNNKQLTLKYWRRQPESFNLNNLGYCGFGKVFRGRGNQNYYYLSAENGERLRIPATIWGTDKLRNLLCELIAKNHLHVDSKTARKLHLKDKSYIQD